MTSSYDLIRFPVSPQHPAPDAGLTASWGGRRADGSELRATNTAFTLDGRTFPIVSGELIAQRYPHDEWRDAIRSLRAGGCTAVSSYIFWSLIEPARGTFDFTGANDIRRFAELCHEEGMLLIPRVGPFNNSEFLLGGLPPWLFGLPVTERSNDPGYLRLVGSYFAAVADQLRDLLWQDDGPIIAIQLENELSHAPNDWRTLFGYTAGEHRGPSGPEFGQHMSALRALAIEAGMPAPFFTMTGWRTAGEIPPGEFLPTYGAYMDLHPHWHANHPLTTFGHGEYPYAGTYPMAFCELGTGSPARAAYRSTTPTEMTVTTTAVRLGAANSTFLGYYVFHGGTNPVRGDGFGWTTKEPAFAQRSYDFWAPVSEFGERRDSFYALSVLNRLVTEFADELARTVSLDPEEPVIDPAEDRLRARIRTDGRSGFVFLSNYGNATPLSPRDNVRIEVTAGGEVIRFPLLSELRVATGENRILPFNLSVTDTVTLRSSTAQPLARLGGAAPALMLFSDLELAEIVLADTRPDALTAPRDASVHAVGGDAVVVVPVRENPVVVVRDGHGDQARIVIVSAAVAEHSQKDADWWLSSPDDLTVDHTRAVVERRRALDELHPENSSLLSWQNGAIRQHPVQFPGVPIPTEAIRTEWLTDSRVLLTATDVDAADLPDLWVDIDYEGDLARLFDAETGVMLADDFHRGIAWRVKIGRFADALLGEGLQLRIEPKARTEAVDDPDGILLDSATHVEGAARVAALTFSCTVRGHAALSELTDS